jgi:hypothetical protein
MTAKNDGGPAFPVYDDHGQYVNGGGATLRDYFAAKAMQGMLANPNQDYAPLTTKAEEAVVAGAYEMADAMLKARETP